MNVPNMLSLTRIALVPVFTWLYFSGDLKSALAVLLISAVSDMLDGTIARRFNMETRLGRALDPVADKLFEAAMMLCAASVEKTVWLLLGLHLLRELSLAAMALYVVRHTGTVMHARWFGKLCTVSIYALMLAIIALPDFSGSLARMGTALCCALVIVCAVLYMAEFLRLLRRKKAP